MIQLIISFVSLFVWLLYETDWLRVNLMSAQLEPVKKPWLLRQWLKTFSPYFSSWNIGYGYYHKLREYPEFSEPAKKTGYQLLATFIYNCRWYYDMPNVYRVFVSPGIVEPLCSKKWLDKHWADLEDYHPTVELYFGNGCRQTFTLKKPELMKQIIKINTGKKYFKQLAVERS